MRIPFLDLSRADPAQQAELGAAVERVIRQGRYILGPETAAFEHEWAQYCGCAAAAGVANGTDAIALALLASGAIQRGHKDEVITTPLTAGYTALGIRNAGGVPVYADIDPRTWNIDPASVEERISERTCAIVPVHLYGYMANMPALYEIAKKHRLVVVEDAAHAHGARLGGKGPGTYSNAAAFSFYPTKNLGALGDGGAVVSNDPLLIERVKTLRQGAHPEAMKGEIAGRNSRLDELQAAVLRVRLKYLDRANRARRALARKYDLVLRDLPRIRRQHALDAAAHVYHLYVIQHPRRDAIRTYLEEQGIETMVHYPWLLHRQKLFMESRPGTYMNAEHLATQILSLPLHPDLREHEVSEVARCIAAFEALDVVRGDARVEPDSKLVGSEASADVQRHA